MRLIEHLFAGLGVLVTLAAVAIVILRWAVDPPMQVIDPTLNDDWDDWSHE